MFEQYKIFQTNGGNIYLYDTPTNSIHSWNPPLTSEFTSKLYSVADRDLRNLVYSINDRTEYKEQLLFYLQLWRMKSKAFRNPEQPSHLFFSKFEDIPNEKKGPVWMSDLVLIVSEACNLRCDYCTYTASYPGYRSHSKHFMTLEVAIKAIDKFFSYNNEHSFRGYSDRNINIVFYGGEPLLNFDIIQKTILYSEMVRKEHYGVVFSVSTNLTLLKDEYLSFFRDHNVYLNVSFDGPSQEHDRYRHFNNGKPTYQTVLDNLKRIHNFDKEFYFNKVRLLPTLNGNSDAIVIYDFFKKMEHDLPPFLMVNFLKNLSFSNFHKVHKYDKNIFAKRIQNVINSYIEQKLDGRNFLKGDFLYHFIEVPLINIFYRIQTYGNSLSTWFTGTCLPGRKLAVSPDGTFHICERINEHFPIGDVEMGLDKKKLLNVVNLYFESIPRCNLCWARNLCTICYATVCDKGFFNFDKHCKFTQEQAQANISLLFSILEKRRDAFISDDYLISPCVNAEKNNDINNFIEKKVD